MPEPISDCENDVTAAALYDALKETTAFTIPDLTGADFTIPETSDTAYPTLTPLNEGDLTERKVEGKGMFDGLMEALNVQIQSQYAEGRIASDQYAEAYVGVTTAALGNAVQYLLSKDQAHWQAVLVQQQARAAEITAIAAKVALEEAKVRLLTAELEMKRQSSELALTKMRIAGEDANICLTKAKIAAQEYETANISPAEVSRINSQTAVGTAQAAQSTYETASVLPAQVNKLNSEKAATDYQYQTVLPAQVAGMTADTVGKVYNNENILPVQKLNVQEQMEANRAKTMDIRSDGVTLVEGSIGKQKDLHFQQIKSYEHDSQIKTTRMLVDSWITQKTLDDGLTPPTQITDSYINSALSGVRTNIGI